MEQAALCALTSVAFSAFFSYYAYFKNMNNIVLAVLTGNVPVLMSFFITHQRYCWSHIAHLRYAKLSKLK